MTSRSMRHAHSGSLPSCFHFLFGSGHTYDEEREDQTQQGQQPPALDPHQDKGRHAVGLQEDLTVDGGCGAPWWFGDGGSSSDLE